MIGDSVEIKILAYAMTIFLVSTLSFILLLWSDKSPIKILKSLFFIPARKSTTNAIVLGGLVLSISTMMTLYFYSSLNSSPEIYLLMKGLFFTTLIITLHGHIDDKFEISARYKLCCQAISTGAFLFFLHLATPDLSLLAITPIIIFWGFGTLNGSNLLDGLDTISFKISFTTFLFYFFIGFYYGIDGVKILSLLFVAPLISFYIFNRAPAKIHLGEIGGNLLGMCYLFLSSFVFVMTYKEIGLLNSTMLSLIPLTLPMVELAISFLRRIFFKRSPFHADRLHMHHILTLHKKMKPSSAASVIAVFYALTLILTALTIVYVNIILASIILPLSLITIYLVTCLETWKREELKTPIFYQAANRLKKKRIKVIHADIIDEFVLTITPKFK